MEIQVLPVTMGFLDTTGGGGALSGSLGGQLLTRSFSSSGLTSCLLGTSHYDKVSPKGNINLKVYIRLFMLNLVTLLPGVNMFRKCSFSSFTALCINNC